MLVGAAGHLSKFLQPMLTSRLPEAEAEAALGAKLITGRIESYPHIITKVLLWVVVVLGARYIGEGKLDVYKRFVRGLIAWTGGLSILTSCIFFAISSWVYSMYTDHETIRAECESVTPALAAKFCVGICSKQHGRKMHPS